MLRGFDTIERDRRRARIGRSGAWHEFRTMAESIDAELMSILVCPESHARLVQVGDWLYSTDPATRRRYPVRDGIPIMLIDESEVIDQSEHAEVMRHVQESTPNG